jgi:hypothetical protein
MIRETAPGVSWLFRDLHDTATRGAVIGRLRRSCGLELGASSEWGSCRGTPPSGRHHPPQACRPCLGCASFDKEARFLRVLTRRSIASLLIIFLNCKLLPPAPFLGPPLIHELRLRRNYIHHYFSALELHSQPKWRRLTVRSFFTPPRDISPVYICLRPHPSCAPNSAPLLPLHYATTPH